MAAPLLASLACAVLALIFFSWLAEEVFEGETNHFDLSVRAFIHHYSSAGLTKWMQGVTFLGSPYVLFSLFTICCAGFLLAKWPRAAAWLAVGVIGSVVLDTVAEIVVPPGAAGTILRAPAALVQLSERPRAQLLLFLRHTCGAVRYAHPQPGGPGKHLDRCSVAGAGDRRFAHLSGRALSHRRNRRVCGGRRLGQHADLRRSHAQRAPLRPRADTLQQAPGRWRTLRTQILEPSRRQIYGPQTMGA